MSTYVIGDVQGCRATLEALLERCAFDPTTDHLWFAGDLVNRGPDSLGVLRLCRSLNERVVVVLGNHDLYLLGRAAGVPARGADTLASTLDAPDAPALLDWLRSRPMAHHHNGALLIHAGLLPSWRLADTLAAARLIEARLRRADGLAFARALHVDRETRASELGHAAAALTRARLVRPDGHLDAHHSGPPEEAPPDLRPWYVASDVPGGEAHVFFGHWAALGHRVGDGWCSLDSGCVWGRSLTAWRLEDGRVTSQATLAEDRPRNA